MPYRQVIKRIEALQEQIGPNGPCVLSLFKRLASILGDGEQANLRDFVDDALIRFEVASLNGQAALQQAVHLESSQLSE